MSTDKMKQKKLFESALRKGATAGWVAACRWLADEFDKAGASDFAAVARNGAANPPQIDVEEIKGRG